MFQGESNKPGGPVDDVPKVHELQLGSASGIRR